MGEVTIAPNSVFPYMNTYSMEGAWKVKTVSCITCTSHRKHYKRHTGPHFVLIWLDYVVGREGYGC